ncbi:sodium:proton antiporter [uncultured Draconibacterium sp.]|uniref:sodium:proton antiporter n=1 Tax=uncultured Draconibacterium sp. TaxID=1573823 RepID=UPI0032180B7C
METIALITAFALILIGIYGILSNKNIIKIIVGFWLFETGLHVLIVTIGYIKGGTAPILDDAVGLTNVSEKIVDPIPQALVLTAIVIGLGVTALMLAYALRMYQAKKSLNIGDFKELKW